MGFNAASILPFAIVAVVFFLAVIGALAWGYGRLSAKNRNK